MDIISRLSLVVKDCPDFPRKEILFKDIMPIFKDPDLVKDTCQTLVDKVFITLNLIVCTTFDSFKYYSLYYI